MIPCPESLGFWDSNAPGGERSLNTERYLGRVKKAVLGAGIRRKQEAQGMQGSFLALAKGGGKGSLGERAVTPGRNRSLTEACTLHPKA